MLFVKEKKHRHTKPNRLKQFGPTVQICFTKNEVWLPPTSVWTRHKLVQNWFKFGICSNTVHISGSKPLSNWKPSVSVIKSRQFIQGRPISYSESKTIECQNPPQNKGRGIGEREKKLVMQQDLCKRSPHTLCSGAFYPKVCIPGCRTDFRIDWWLGAPRKPCQRVGELYCNFYS